MTVFADNADAKTLTNGSDDGTVLLYEWEIISGKKKSDKINVQN